MSLIFYAAGRALLYLITFVLICFVYFFARSQSKKTEFPKWVQYGHAIFWSGVIAFFVYSSNDGTVEECEDVDPIFGGGNCYVTDEYEVDENERKEKAGAIFIFISLLACMGIKDSNEKENIFDGFEDSIGKS